jgi:hypothetical protein
LALLRRRLGQRERLRHPPGADQAFSGQTDECAEPDPFRGFAQQTVGGIAGSGKRDLDRVHAHLRRRNMVRGAVRRQIREREEPGMRRLDGQAGS